MVKDLRMEAEDVLSVTRWCLVEMQQISGIMSRDITWRVCPLTASTVTRHSGQEILFMFISQRFINKFLTYQNFIGRETLFIFTKPENTNNHFRARHEIQLITNVMHINRIQK